MGRGRGGVAAVAVSGFDAAVGRRRGSRGGRESREENQWLPGASDASDLISRLREPSGVSATTRLEAMSALAGQRALTGAEADRPQRVAYALADAAFVTRCRREKDGLILGVRLFCDVPIDPLYDAVNLSGPALAAYHRAVASHPADLLPAALDDLAQTALKDELRWLMMAHLSQEGNWRKLTFYEELHDRFGKRRLRDDKLLSELADRDRLRDGLDDWLDAGAAPQDLRPVLEAALSS